MILCEYSKYTLKIKNMAAAIHLADGTYTIAALYVGDGITAPPQNVVSEVYLGDQQVYP